MDVPVRRDVPVPVSRGGYAGAQHAGGCGYAPQYGQQYGQQYDYNPGNTDMPPPPPPPPGGRHHPGVAPLGMRKVDSVWNPPTDLLPPGWEECEDDEGTVFYFNESTGESRWDRPTAARWSGRL